MVCNMCKQSWNLQRFHIIGVVVVLSVFSLANCQQTKQKCALNGEYCLTHVDCCSGSCLSFSYKCVPVPPSASVGSTLVPIPLTPFDSGNRFGESGVDGGASLTQKTCALDGEYCLTHAECCSSSCLTFSYKCVPLNPPRTSTATVSSTTIDLQNRVNVEDQRTSSTTTNKLSTQKKCSDIGEYCLTPNDCCSGSCLSFSYKCVTNHNLKGPVNQQPTENIVNRFGASGSTSASTCAAVGEYCLTSSDCCSKSCLSFAYKCVNRYDLMSAVGEQGSTISTANRFGGSKEPVNTNNASKCTTNGLYCFHNQECCSGACFKSICSTEIRIGVPESELTRPSASNGPYIPVRDLDDLITRFSNSSNTTKQTANRQLRQQQCKVVGDSCNQHGDCCSNTCHSYRRKCVN
ncbi:uncharacterized protein LOC128271558 [Anopheles cruzii]|uniref:uncharacterized protein LOC128271558 n=1 Tax=Anopheles cruzii TaxID=68878 RepID=UPI0022EC2A45|nr:uncharacterized protein LOC128271558 [Anopheles cruzii]